MQLQDGFADFALESHDQSGAVLTLVVFFRLSISFLKLWVILSHVLVGKTDYAWNNLSRLLNASAGGIYYEFVYNEG